MGEVKTLIHEYREWFYLITVAWTFFEGESFVLAAAAVSAHGTLDPFKLGAAAWLGSYLGDQCWFFLGRQCGPILLRRFPQWRVGIDVVHRWIDRWGTLFVLSFRFIYGVRNFSSVALGLSEMSVARFMILNFISAGLWAVTFVTAGYYSGRIASHYLGRWGTYVEVGALALFLGVVATIVLISRWRIRRARRLRALMSGQG